MSGFDLHEVLITRGVVQKAPLLTRLAIHAVENCVGVHATKTIYPITCHQVAQHYKEGRILATQELLKDYDKVIEWLDVMSRLMKGKEPDDARRWIKHTRSLSTEDVPSTTELWEHLWNQEG
jgi:hypothetical protein